MRFKCVVLSLLALSVIFISGCNVGILSTNSLISPPKPTGDGAYICDAIEESIKEEIKLKYPKRGDYRSSIIVRDKLCNGNEGAVAFYSTKLDSIVNVAILSKIDDNWRCLSTFNGLGTDIDKICFADVNNDGTDEIVLGWSTHNNAKKFMAAYYYVDNQYKAVEITETYTDFFISDMNNDNKDEILILSLSDERKSATARLIALTPGNLFADVISMVGMDPYVTEYNSIIFGNIDKTRTGVFVDAKRANDTLSTEVIFWDDNEKSLVNPLYKNAINYYDSVDEKIQIGSKDIDSDGIIEMPMAAYANGKHNETSDTESAVIIFWRKCLLDEQLTEFLTITASDYKNYIFKMPQEWYGNVDVNKEKGTNTLIFSEMVKTTKDNVSHDGVDILKIRVLNDHELEELKKRKEEFIELVVENSKHYIASIPEKSSRFSISEEQIRERFSLLDK